HLPCPIGNNCKHALVSLCAVFPVVGPVVPLGRPWWSEMDFIVLGTVGCASVVFLLSAIIICYKAIKRKPLRKEENGTSRGEYAMSIRNKKAMGTNNTVV
uniref:Si:dkey-85n7.6 n=1 Tax=Neogobius melanostomus TaxID=47308 RepID=A0A8C6SYB1_9GOBI